jgi:hypothetical protein
VLYSGNRLMDLDTLFMNIEEGFAKLIFASLENRPEVGILGSLCGPWVVCVGHG